MVKRYEIEVEERYGQSFCHGCRQGLVMSIPILTYLTVTDLETEDKKARSYCYYHSKAFFKELESNEIENSFLLNPENYGKPWPEEKYFSDKKREMRKV